MWDPSGNKKSPVLYPLSYPPMIQLLHVFSGAVESNDPHSKVTSSPRWSFIEFKLADTSDPVHMPCRLVANTSVTVDDHQSNKKMTRAN